mmetsp:Transcript_14751/g.34134  ORF Transcript_14751/g.34134 Transcript_14751/m.34134 type:complete len:135 (+) Transcript_14751:551-955(+)
MERNGTERNGTETHEPATRTNTHTYTHTHTQTNSFRAVRPIHLSSFGRVESRTQGREGKRRSVGGLVGSIQTSRGERPTTDTTARLTFGFDDLKTTNRIESNPIQSNPIQSVHGYLPTDNKKKMDSGTRSAGKQ